MMATVSRLWAAPFPHLEIRGRHQVRIAVVAEHRVHRGGVGPRLVLMRTEEGQVVPTGGVEALDLEGQRVVGHVVKDGIGDSEVAEGDRVEVGFRLLGQVAVRWGRPDRCSCRWAPRR